MEKKARVAFRVPKSVVDRIKARHDYIFSQPELALARRDATTAQAYVLMKGLEYLEDEIAAQERKAMLLAAAEHEKRVGHSPGQEVNSTISLGNIYKDWARNTTEED